LDATADLGLTALRIPALLWKRLLSRILCGGIGSKLARRQLSVASTQVRACVATPTRSE
jgi:hypothetical protein